MCFSARLLKCFIAARNIQIYVKCPPNLSFSFVLQFMQNSRTALERKKERASYLGFDLINEWMTKLIVILINPEATDMLIIRQAQTLYTRREYTDSI